MDALFLLIHLPTHPPTHPLTHYSPPAFAFIAFDDPRDARDAVYYRDGYDFDGGRIRVEEANDSRRRDDRGG